MTTHQTAPTLYIPFPSTEITYAYRRLGPPATPSTPPLLFLIHFRGTIDHWDPLLINTLAASRPVILLDYPGVGHSTGRIAATYSQSADDIITFLSLINEKEVDILGFSIGGFVAQMVALNADPAVLKVRKLVLAGTGSSFGPEMPPNPTWAVEVASAPELTLEGFQKLFFPDTEGGRRASVAWWGRIHERNLETSGEERSEWLSTGYKDGGEGLKTEVEKLIAFVGEETSKGREGAWDRLGDFETPVLVANGKVCSLLIMCCLACELTDRRMTR
jgi:pimeloyl-ACP methyl ester carboxylesterase